MLMQQRCGFSFGTLGCEVSHTVLQHCCLLTALGPM